MNVFEFEEAEIACIESRSPFCAKNDLSFEMHYEWFYFELIDEESQIVLILSLKDPFFVKQKENEKIPASIYFTWHVKNKLKAYSYTILNDTAAAQLEEKLSAFLKNTRDSIELWFPDFSLEKLIHLEFNVNIESDDKNQNEKTIHSQKKHFWQFVTNSKTASGFVETVTYPIDLFHQNNIKHPVFFDLPTRNKLKKESFCRKSFHNSRIYFDHNFGLEPIFRIKQEWSWWHAESEEKWEVSYLFPHSQKFFHLNSSEKTVHICEYKSQSQSMTKKLNHFLFFTPKKIALTIFETILFDFNIECAPFYARSKIKKNGPVTSTLETLIPNRIPLALNQILIKSRQIKSHLDLSFNEKIERFIPFSEICRIITQNNGKSFYFASVAIQKQNRLFSYFSYAICRLIDDATDEWQKTTGRQGSAFSQKLLDVLWDDVAVDTENIFVLHLKENLSFALHTYINTESVIHFIHESKKLIHKQKINKSYFIELLQGQLMDENFEQPKTIPLLYQYCFRVAGVVGLIMAHVFNVRSNQKALIAAEHMGIAMQITNILRDVKEDFEKGRVYLPGDICQKHKIHFSQKLFSDSNYCINEKSKLIQEMIELNCSYYRSAIMGIKYISQTRYRLCAKLMCANYAAILSKIQKNHLVPFQHRVIVSKFEKIIIFFKVILGADPLDSTGIKEHAPQQEKFKHEKL